MRFVAVVVAMCSVAGQLAAQPKWRLIEELRIGGADDGPTSFSEIRDIAVDSSGRIAVYDTKEKEIRLFEASGKFLTTLGRTGQGPGEFNEPSGIGFAKDGVLWVNDVQNQRLVAFAANGPFLRQTPLRTRAFPWRWSAVFGDLGILLQQTTVFGKRSYDIVRRIELVSGKADSIVKPMCIDEVKDSTRLAIHFPIEGGVAAIQLPFAPLVHEALSPAGELWCSSGEEYRVRLVQVAEGTEVADVRRSIPAVSIPPAVRDGAIRALRANPMARQITVDPSRVSKTYPSISALDVDDEGRAWVRRESDKGAVADVWSRSGKQVATLQLPSTVTTSGFLVIRRDRVYAIWRDENQVPYVIRYRVVH